MVGGRGQGDKGKNFYSYSFGERFANVVSFRLMVPSRRDVPVERLYPVKPLHRMMRVTEKWGTIPGFGIMREQVAQRLKSHAE